MDSSNYFLSSLALIIELDLPAPLASIFRFPPDEIIIFHTLSRADLVQAVEIQLRHVSALLAARGYQLDISPEARAHLAEVGDDVAYGARPLKWAIQRELQDPLAVKILGGEFPEGEIIRVERGKGKTGIHYTGIRQTPSSMTPVTNAGRLRPNS